MKRTLKLKCLSALFLLPCLLQAQSVIVKQNYYLGRYYLAAQAPINHKINYFALDMETAKEIPDTVLARQLFKYQIGTDGLMQDYVTDTAKGKQKYKLMKWRDNQPGSLYYRDIKAFDEILERDEDLMKKKKKEDKKNNILNQYYVPSQTIIFNERSERYFLFSTYGIYSVHQDSLKMPASTVFEYTGFRFKGLSSARLFNPDVYIMEFELGTNRKFYKVFDSKTGAFANVPGLDEMSDAKCLLSRSSPYAVFYGDNNDTKSYRHRAIVYNYTTMNVEADIPFSFPNATGGDYYLHNNLLYCRYSYLTREWQDGLDSYDLKNNGKKIYSFKVK